MAVHPGRSALIPLTLGLLFCITACSRPPAADSSNSDSQKLPFDRQPHSTGMSPSQSLIPSTTKLPEGTPILIRLQSGLSSATAHPGDTFSATVDEPVVVDGQSYYYQGDSPRHTRNRPRPRSQALCGRA